MPTLPYEQFEYELPRPVVVGDEIPTHMRINPLDNEKIYYYGSSKYFRHVDPDIKDPTSIQYMPCYHTYYMVKK